jgi:hypothetical protein
MVLRVCWCHVGQCELVLGENKPASVAPGFPLAVHIELELDAQRIKNANGKDFSSALMEANAIGTNFESQVS